MWMILQAVTLAVGLSTSVGLGEDGPALTTGYTVQTSYLENRGWLDLSSKHETGQGYLLGQTILGIAGPVVGGLDFRYRSGGPWHKNVSWGILGLQGYIGGALVRVSYRPELTHTNELQMFDLLLRTPITKRLVLEYRPTLVRYQQKTGTGWTPVGTGFATEALIGITF